MKPLARTLFMYIPLWIALLAPGAVAAQGPCAVDLQKHCPGLQGFAALKCLNQHEATLSAPCKNHLEAVAKRRAAVKALASACSADAERFCKAAKAAPQLDRCLHQHEAGLSPACIQARKATAQRRAAAWARLQACKGDIQKFCKDVKPGGSGLLKCLAAHRAELSPECRGSGTAKKVTASDKKPAATAK